MVNASGPPPESNLHEPWYHGVSGYQWLVLAIASAGWIFDVYEGQIFNITRNQMLSDILGSEGGDVKKYGDMFLGIFLLGGTVGGLAAGSLADRFGRRPIMVVTILMYSLFSGLTYFATELWHVASLRFLVAMGVGGEWAVAASLVAEVFPARAQAQASGIFHASSVLGTWMAALAGMAVGAQWRYAYLFGIVPALLVLWVRASVREPRKWQETKAQAESANRGGQLGSFRDLLLNPVWGPRAFLGMGLAAVGLGTFWAVTVAGQDLARELLVRGGASSEVVAQHAKFAYGIVQTTGGAVGLLSFGPLCAVRAPANVHRDSIAGVPFRPDNVFPAANLSRTALALATVWIPDAGPARGLCDLLPGVVPHAFAGHGNQFLFQRRTHPGRAGIVFLRMAQGAGRHGPASRNLVAGSAISRGCGVDAVSTGNKRKRTA